MSQFFKSECGQYLCRSVRGDGWPYEAWTIDGCVHWRDDNRIRTSADVEKYHHPMAYCVGGYSCQQTGQKKGSFTLDLLHCDTTKIIEPGKGNTIIESIKVVFRRKVPPQHVPKWLSSETAAPVVATGEDEGESPCCGCRKSTDIALLLCPTCVDESIKESVAAALRSGDES